MRLAARVLQFGTPRAFLFKTKGVLRSASVPRVLQSRNGTVVDQVDPSWNLLLVELSQLSRIVEQSANDGDHGSSSTAAPELRER